MRLFSIIFTMAHIIHDVYSNEKPIQRFGNEFPDPSCRLPFFGIENSFLKKLACRRRWMLGFLLSKINAFLWSARLAWLRNCAKTCYLSYHSGLKCECPTRAIRAQSLNDGESITYTLQLFEYSFEGKSSPYRLKRAGALYAF